MEFSYFTQFLTIVAVLLSVVNTVAVWMQRGARELARRVEKQDAKLIEHDRRIQKVEDDMRHLPTKEDLGEIGTKLTQVETELTITSRVVNRIDEFLRSRP